MSPEAARSGPSPKVRSLSSQMKEVGVRARAAARVIARAETGQKNAALFAQADTLRAETKALLAANEKDMKAGAQSKLEAPLMDRLELTPQRIEEMADGVRQVANLPDPIGEISDLKS